MAYLPPCLRPLSKGPQEQVWDVLPTCLSFVHLPHISSHCLSILEPSPVWSQEGWSSKETAVGPRRRTEVICVDNSRGIIQKWGPRLWVDRTSCSVDVFAWGRGANGGGQNAACTCGAKGSTPLALCPGALLTDWRLVICVFVFLQWTAHIFSYQISMIPDLPLDTCHKPKFSNIYFCRPCPQKIIIRKGKNAFRTLILMRAATKKVDRHLTIRPNQGRCCSLCWKFCRCCLFS